MAAASFPDGVTVAGTSVFSGTVTLPAGCVTSTAFNGSDPLTVAKQRHQYIRRQAQNGGTAATAQTSVIHRAKSAGTVTAFKVGNIATAVGDSTVTVDLKKNGTTILSGTMSLTAGSPAAYAATSGTISSAAYSAGDVFTVVQTVTAGTGTLPQGVDAEATFDEAA